MSNVKKNSKFANKIFTVDFINGTIIGTKTAFERAGKGEKRYYQELTRLLKVHPTFTCVVKELEKKSENPKKDYKGMNLEFMRRYIANVMDNSNDLLGEFDLRKKSAKELKLPVYPKMKKWFLSVVDPDGNGFDMQEALEMILESETKKALHNSDTNQNEFDNAVVLSQTA